MTGIADLVARIAALPRDGTRHLVAICGAPASGKSTLADTLAQALTDAGRPAQVVPMDGFHLDNALLGPRGLLPRKGAPQSFDLAGFAALLHRLRAGGAVIFPRFDRSLDRAIAGAGEMPAACDLALVEGNYLCLDLPGWRDLAPLWSLSLRLDVPIDVLEARLLARWVDHGLDPQAARQRAMGNDLPNARACIDHALPTDLTLQGQKIVCP